MSAASLLVCRLSAVAQTSCSGNSSRGMSRAPSKGLVLPPYLQAGPVPHHSCSVPGHAACGPSNQRPDQVPDQTSEHSPLSALLEGRAIRVSTHGAGDADRATCGRRQRAGRCVPVSCSHLDALLCWQAPTSSRPAQPKGSAHWHAPAVGQGDRQVHTSWKTAPQNTLLPDKNRNKHHASSLPHTSVGVGASRTVGAGSTNHGDLASRAGGAAKAITSGTCKQTMQRAKGQIEETSEHAGSSWLHMVHMRLSAGHLHRAAHAQSQPKLLASHLQGTMRRP